MSYTQGQLDALRDAYASGYLTVEYAGRRLTYRSRAEMAQIIATIEAALSPSTAPRRSSVAEYDPR